MDLQKFPLTAWVAYRLSGSSSLYTSLPDRYVNESKDFIVLKSSLSKTLLILARIQGIILLSCVIRQFFLNLICAVMCSMLY